MDHRFERPFVQRTRIRLGFSLALLFALGLSPLGLSTPVLRGEETRFASLRNRLEKRSTPPLSKREAAEFARLCLVQVSQPASSRSSGLTRSELLDLGSNAAVLSENYEIVANCGFSKARLLIEKGEIAHAQKTLEEASKLCENRAPAMGPWLLMELANLARRTGELDRVLPYLDEASQGVDLGRFRRSAKHDSLQCTIYGERGRFFQKIGNLDLAARWFRKEQELAASPELRVRLPIQQTRWLNEIRFSLAKKDYRRAISSAERARTLQPTLRFSKARLAELATLETIAHFRTGTASPNELLAALEHPLLDPSTRIAPLLRLAWDLTIAHELDRAQTVFESARENLAKIEEDSTPLDSSYRRVLLDTVASRLARARGDGDLTSQLAASRHSFEVFLEVWAKSPRLKGGVGFLQFRDQARIVGEMLSLVLTAQPGTEGVKEAFSLLLRAQALGVLSRELGPEGPFVLSRVQRELVSPNRGMVVFHFAPEQSHAFVVESSSLTHLVLPSRARLQRARDDVVAHLLRPAQRDEQGRVEEWDRLVVRKATERLSELLLIPALRTHLGSWKGATLVGDDQLDWIPFSCLLLEQRKDQEENGGKAAPREPVLLGTRLALSYLPSVPVGLALSARLDRTRNEIRPRQGPRLSVVYFGPQAERAHSDKDKGKDKNAKKALPPPHALKKLYPESQFELRETFPPPSLESVDILQFLTHGSRDPDAERPATLLVRPNSASPQGTLRSGDLEGLTLPPMVFLTACGSDRGPARRGEGAVSSLAGAFLRGGAACVLASPADLPTAPTLSLNEKLHEALVRGAPLAEALRSAREIMAKERPEDHPVSTCLLRVIGLGQESIFP